MTEPHPLVGVVMGSASDWQTLQHTAAILAEFGVPHECRVISAHRMPDDITRLEVFMNAVHHITRRQFQVGLLGTTVLAFT